MLGVEDLLCILDVPWRHVGTQEADHLDYLPLQSGPLFPGARLTDDVVTYLVQIHVQGILTLHNTVLVYTPGLRLQTGAVTHLTQVHIQSIMTGQNIVCTPGDRFQAGAATYQVQVHVQGILTLQITVNRPEGTTV